MTERQPAIRVNLRFGPRTDPALMRELSSLSRVERARWIRAWMIAGWRLRDSGSKILHGADESNVRQTPGRMPGARENRPAHPIGGPVHQPANETPEDGILGFLGQRIL